MAGSRFAGIVIGGPSAGKWHEAEHDVIEMAALASPILPMTPRKSTQVVDIIKHRYYFRETWHAWLHESLLRDNGPHEIIRELVTNYRPLAEPPR